jgi:aldose 1-epimerase
MFVGYNIKTDFMKKMFGALMLCLAMASCSSNKSEIVIFPESDFNIEVDGSQVSVYTLKAGDIVMQVTNFGARVVSLWTPDRNGHYDDIVLG